MGLIIGRRSPSGTVTFHDAASGRRLDFACRLEKVIIDKVLGIMGPELRIPSKCSNESASSVLSSLCNFLAYRRLRTDFARQTARSIPAGGGAGEGGRSLGTDKSGCMKPCSRYGWRSLLVPFRA